MFPQGSFYSIVSKFFLNTEIIHDVLTWNNAIAMVLSIFLDEFHNKGTHGR